MELTRRAITLGGVSAALMLAVPASAAVGTRQLELYRGDSRIGEQGLRVERNGPDVDVTVSIDIDVRVIGLPVYRYVLDARERWSNGALVSLTAKTNDDGTAHFVEARRTETGIEVAGSAYTGTVGGLPATTSYWSPAFLERPVWISTQDGRPLEIRASNLGQVEFPGTGGAVTATRWQITGEIEGLELFYDTAGEWIGSQFNVSGETLRLVASGRGGALTPLWVQA